MTHEARHRSTLETARVTQLLARLFAASAASDEQVRATFGAISSEERARRMADPHEFREIYTRAKDLYLAVSPETARLLYMLARSIRARAIVEFGTSFGISTIHLAAALRDNGGGRLIGSELMSNKVAEARTNLSAAGLDDLVEVREGDAQETLARELPETLDMVLLDGHKGLYPRVLDLLLPRLRPGALLVADNADASPDYLARVRAVGGGFHSVPLGGEVELTIKL